MAKKNVAVYDDSEGYIKRFLEYVSCRGLPWLEVIGFTQTKALKEYLEKNRVDLLLFSLESFVEEKRDREAECDFFINHANVREFVYFGERRNSHSQVKHMNKYRSMEEILSDMQEILFGENGPGESGFSDPKDAAVELIGFYDITGYSVSVQGAIEIAEELSATKEVLLIDLERFTVLPEITRTDPDSSISDLIFFYKTNPAKLKENLLKKKKRFNGIDILSSPEDPEDMEEIPEREWPAFLKKIGLCGGYDAVIVHIGEAFHSLIWMFDACSRIYMPGYFEYSEEIKMRKFAGYFMNRGRKDLYEKSQRMMICEDAEWTLSGMDRVEKGRGKKG